MLQHTKYENGISKVGKNTNENVEKVEFTVTKITQKQITIAALPSCIKNEYTTHWAQTLNILFFNFWLKQNKIKQMLVRAFGHMY